jgi:predicted PurR-regulated permease PerM
MIRETTAAAPGSVGAGPGEIGDSAGSHVQKVLGLALLFALGAGCAVVLQPFFLAILWAAILVISTWPVYLRIERLVNGRRTLAALLTTLLLSTVLLLPLVLLGVRLTDNVVHLADAVRSAVKDGLPPPPPAWLAKVPLVGGRLEASWLAAANDPQVLHDTVQSRIGPIQSWLLARGSDVAQGLVQLSLSLVTAFFFYRDGPAVVRAVQAIMTRIAGERSHRLSAAAATTINGVVRGLLGTSFIQAILAAAGYWVAGIPGAIFLGFVSFFLTLIPAGLALIWLPAAIWLVSKGEKEWGAFVAVWGFIVGALDNVLRPYLMRSPLPFLLLLLGVIGGALSFGLVGIFVGPTLLAVGYSLLQEWSSEAALPEREPVEGSSVTMGGPVS